jgi:hypothetical protein
MEKKTPLLQPNQWNTLTGKQLIEMGERKTTDGYLIANTLYYKVWIKVPHWEIYVTKKPRTANHT